MMNILLIDDNALFSQGVTALFNQESDMNVLGIATSVADIQEIDADPDVILLNTEISQEWIKTYAHHRFPAKRFFYIMPFVDRKQIIQGMQIGVTGFALNSIDPERLITTIRAFYDKQYMITGEIAEILINELVYRQYSEKEIMQQKLEENGITVTNRDLTILHLLYHQKTNQEIKDILGIADKSVRDYVSTVYKHVQIHNRRQLHHYLVNLMKHD